MSSSLHDATAVLSTLLSLTSNLNTAQPSVQVSSLLSVLQTAKSNIESYLVHDDRTAGTRCVVIYLEVLARYLKEGVEMVEEWGRGSKQQIDDLSILTSKLSALMELFLPATKVPSDDLFSKEQTHPSWQRLRQVTSLHVPEDDQRLREKLQGFAKKVAIGNAMLAEGMRFKDGNMRKIVVGGGAMYYFLCRDAAVKQTRLSYANADLDAAKALWNLVDSKLVSPMYQSLIIPIHLNLVIYVPRTAPHVLQPAEEVSSGDKVSHTGKHYIEQLLDEPIYSMAAYTETMDPGRLRVPVRILSPYDLPLSYSPAASCWSLCCSERIRTDHNIKELILHIHGGGFIAMSSNSHQNYTRRWAVDTGTPVISIDYRLAPENRFPDALDDCWQVYMWVVNYSKKYLGVAPHRIVIAGDSAGGHLALGITLRCIQSGLRVPDGLLLTYPCVSLDIQSFSPSLEKCLEDPLVPYSFLKLCAESYLRPSDHPDIDPFLSPTIASPEDLSRFPPVRLMVCSQDPLLDESLRFADRLLNCGVNVKIAQFEGMSHGALNLDLSLGVSEARIMVNKGSEFLKELLEI